MGVFDNFFELGGDSIKLTQLLNRIQDRVDLEVCMKSLFDKGTVVELANCLVKHREQEQTLFAGGRQ